MNCHQLFSTDYGKEPALETRLALLVRSVADLRTLREYSTFLAVL